LARSTAVIVTYNSEDAIANCLQALAHHAPELRVIVVDNASKDQTVAIARYFDVEVIINTDNRGFAAAANQGFRTAKDAPLVLLMNPDVCLQTSLQPLEEAAQIHGVAGGRLGDPSGTPQAGFTIRRFPTPIVLALELLGLNRLWPGNPANRKYRYLDRDLTVPAPADQPAGAFLMIRRDVWAQLGGLNESFWPIWFEDVDFCLRASQAGHSAWFVPAVNASHLGGHSIKKIGSAVKQLYWYDNLLRYVGLHFGTGAVRIICVAGTIGAVPRGLMGMIQERSLSPLTGCFRILSFLAKRFVSPVAVAGRLESDKEHTHAR
jgi:GT2 family glycosyltransferase